MNNLPIDTHDMIKFGHIRKEDVINYYKDDLTFKHFTIMNLDDDHFDIPIDSFHGMWQYTVEFGLGVKTTISLFDGTGPLLLRFDTDLETEHTEILLQDLPDNYEFMSAYVDMGIKLLSKQYTITYRNQVKEILESDWPKYCKHLLHHLIMVAESHKNNIDEIRDNMRLGIPDDIELLSHEEMLQLIKHYTDSVVMYYPKLLRLESCQN
jgi:hypothetical protein